MDSNEERQSWAVPPVRGSYEDLDLSLADRSDPDERRFLIEAEHPAETRALREGRTEVGTGEQAVNVELHLALHEVVTARLWNDYPPETWQTAQRLTALGYDRHEVLHMLMSVVGEEVRRSLSGEQPLSTDAAVEALQALPGTWEAARPGEVLNRAQRRDRRRSKG